MLQKLSISDAVVLNFVLNNCFQTW